MNNLLSIIWIIIQVIIGFNLVFPLLLFLFYGIRQSIVSENKEGVLKHDPDYGIIVTAYEQTDNLPSVVKSLLQLQYSNYLIYIVADKCDISNLHFNDDRVILLRPEETLASVAPHPWQGPRRSRRFHATAFTTRDCPFFRSLRHGLRIVQIQYASRGKSRLRGRSPAAGSAIVGKPDTVRYPVTAARGRRSP